MNEFRNWFDFVSPDIVVNKNYLTGLEMIDNCKSPYFVRLPIDRFVVAHQTAIIKARISATPKPQIQWYKNMKPIFNGPRIKVLKINKNVFYLS